MKTRTISIATAVAASIITATSASAFTAFTSSKFLNIRSGPAEEFAIVGVMERDVRVDARGCLPDFNWCVVTVDGLVGWVFARSIVIDTEEGIIHLSDAADQGRVPVVGADGVLVVVE